MERMENYLLISNVFVWNEGVDDLCPTKHWNLGSFPFPLIWQEIPLFKKVEILLKKVLVWPIWRKITTVNIYQSQYQKEPFKSVLKIGVDKTEIFWFLTLLRSYILVSQKQKKNKKKAWNVGFDGFDFIDSFRSKILYTCVQ